MEVNVAVIPVEKLAQVNNSKVSEPDIPVDVFTAKSMLVYLTHNSKDKFFISQIFYLGIGERSIN